MPQSETLQEKKKKQSKKSPCHLICFQPVGTGLVQSACFEETEAVATASLSRDQRERRACKQQQETKISRDRAMAAASLGTIDIIFIKRGGEDGAQGWLSLSTKDVFRSSGSGKSLRHRLASAVVEKKKSDGPVLNVTKFLFPFKP